MLLVATMASEEAPGAGDEAAEEAPAARIVAPPTVFYHGTKHFWRQRAELDLHIYKCERQYTVVPFHKQRHEEFETLYLDRAKIEALITEVKSDALLSQFEGQKVEKKAGSDMFGNDEPPKEHAHSNVKITKDTVSKFITARLTVVDPLPEPPAATEEPGMESEAASRRPSAGGEEGAADGGAGAAAEGSEAGGEVAAAADEAAPGAEDGGVVFGTEGDIEADDKAHKDTVIEEADDEPSLHTEVPDHRIRGCEMIQLTGDTWTTLEIDNPDMHTLLHERVHKDLDLAAHFADSNTKLQEDAEELNKQRKKSEKFSRAARLALSAFDHLLSKIRKEDPETRAANMLRARWLARKAARKANERLDAQRKKLGLT